MPLYEFTCRACSRTSEILMRASDTPTCPGCGSADLTRLLSVVSVGGRGESEAPIGACGACGDPRGPGSCARD